MGVAEASWINYLNQTRIDSYYRSMSAQDSNLRDSLKELRHSTYVIDHEIIERNRGSLDGMHGFIAEVAEVGISNSRRKVKGQEANVIWINDNGPTDFVRDGLNIQQKFSNANNNLSLNAIKKHYTTYPDYLKNNGKYQIPSDHYDQILYYLSIPKSKANKMPTDTGEFSLKQWEFVHAFFEDKSNPRLSDIEPSLLSYDAVQRSKIHQTMATERASLKETDRQIREQIANDAKPIIQERYYETSFSSDIEEGIAFCRALTSKLSSGKRLSEFSRADWSEVTSAAGHRPIRGNATDVKINELTNYHASSAFVANSIASAQLGIAEQTNLYRRGLLTENQYVSNCMMICVESSVSALSSTVGNALIPIPVLGAVLGNTVGTLLVEITKGFVSDRERQLIAGYLNELAYYNRQLEAEYQLMIRELNAFLHEYQAVLSDAFVINGKDALDGSARLAFMMGVPQEEILKTQEDIDDYFLK